MIGICTSAKTETSLNAHDTAQSLLNCRNVEPKFGICACTKTNISQCTAKLSFTIRKRLEMKPATTNLSCKTCHPATFSSSFSSFRVSFMSALTLLSIPCLFTLESSSLVISRLARRRDAAAILCRACSLLAL
jgi:hypothetical protein